MHNVPNLVGYRLTPPFVNGTYGKTQNWVNPSTGQRLSPSECVERCVALKGSGETRQMWVQC